MNHSHRQTVVAILYPGCIFFELALALELLAERFDVVYATPDGSDHLASNGSTLKVEFSYCDIEPEDCRAVLIPGGDPGSIRDNIAINELIQSASGRGSILAAICAGPFVLAKAGVLKGKRVAHGYSSDQIKFLSAYFEGALLTDRKFEWDGNVITARPDAHIDFAVELACRLEVISAGEASAVKNYYRGL